MICPLPSRLLKKAALQVGGGLFLLTLFAPTQANAQLRLDDLFSTQTMTLSVMTLEDFENDPLAAERALETLKTMLEAGAFRDVLPASEPLAAWLNPTSEEYGTVLYIRARAYRGLNQTTALKTIGANYLRTFGERAQHSGWFLMELARESAREGNNRTAMGFWLRLLETNHEITPEDGLAGARLFLNAAQPRDTRRVLNRVFRGSNLDVATRDQLRKRDVLHIESLLLRDDADTPLPEPWEGSDRETVSFNLRRAMVHEIRHGIRETAPVYRALSEHADALPSAEREILRSRIAQSDRAPWPPRE